MQIIVQVLNALRATAKAFAGDQPVRMGYERLLMLLLALAVLLCLGEHLMAVP